jgi:hypothetical protein
MAGELDRLMSDQQVLAVFEAWRRHRPNPGRVKLTPARASVIRARLRDHHSVEELSLLVGEYAHEADTKEATWWRGDNPEGTEYLDIINLLRSSKTAGRVERAWEWKHGQQGTGVEPDVDLGPMALFRGPQATGRVLRRG